MTIYSNASFVVQRIALLLVILSGLTYCTSVPSGPDRPSAQNNPLFSQAQQALYNQQYNQAGELFYQLASQSVPPQKGLYLSKALDAFLLAKNTQRITDITASLANSTSNQSSLTQLLLAQAYLKQGLADKTELVLEKISLNTLNEQQQIEFHTLRSEAFLQAGNLLESARERIVLDQMALEPAAKFDNQHAILNSLALLSNQALEFLKSSSDKALAGWIDLTLTLKKHHPENLNNPAIVLWRDSYMNHSANEGFLTNLLEQQKIDYKTPQNIAVFLPTSGSLSNVASSIRKGILSAAFSLKSRWQPNLTFYDTSSAPIETLYQNAINDGVNTIIGPLEKNNVAKIGLINELPIPVIALNKVANIQQKNLFQFSLSPEDEAAQIASLAWLQGHQNVLILTPKTSFGQRIAGHFSQVWQQFGGQVLEVQTYTPRKADYSVPIKSLLNLDESIARFKQLRSRLNLSMSFEERRRHDADFVFLISTPREGRLIKPQLRFHRAASLAVFSTSKIHEGKLNKVADRDLNGLTFCDMPWMIDNKSTQNLSPALLLNQWNSIPSTHQRLFSLGLDAYQVIPHIERLKSNPQSRFSGETGILTIDKQLHINRQLSCAFFKNGVVKSTGLAPTLDTLVNMQSNENTLSPSNFSNPQRDGNFTSPLR